VSKEEGLLAKTTSSYYNLLMWKDYEKASALVDAEKRDEFGEFVQKYENELNITSYEIKEVAYTPGENKSLVKVRINYYKYPSVSEKSVVLEDRWVLKEKNWYVDSDFDGEVFK
jgi:hypothetical protein